jgi:hypothetical protein
LPFPRPARARWRGGRMFRGGAGTGDRLFCGGQSGEIISFGGELKKPESLAPHLIGRLVLAQSDVNRVPQKVVGGPGQIGDLGDELWLDPMNAR